MEFFVVFRSLFEPRKRRQHIALEKPMAKAMGDEEDRSGETASGRTPDELMKVAS